MILGSSIFYLFKWDHRSRSTAMQFHQGCEAISVSAWIVLEVIRDGSLQKLRLPYNIYPICCNSNNGNSTRNSNSENSNNNQQ